jgi:hypothetical protein
MQSQRCPDNSLCNIKKFFDQLKMYTIELQQERVTANCNNQNGGYAQTVVECGNFFVT